MEKMERALFCFGPGECLLFVKTSCIIITIIKFSSITIIITVIIITYRHSLIIYPKIEMAASFILCKVALTFKLADEILIQMKTTVFKLVSIYV